MIKKVFYCIALLCLSNSVLSKDEAITHNEQVATRMLTEAVLDIPDKQDLSVKRLYRFYVGSGKTASTGWMFNIAGRYKIDVAPDSSVKIHKGRRVISFTSVRRQGDSTFSVGTKHKTARLVIANFDGFGELYQFTARDGERVFFKARIGDPNSGRVVRRITHNAILDYAYDDGKLVNVVSSLGTSLSIEYDNNQRIVSISHSNGKSKYYAYDTLGRLNAVSSKNEINSPSMTFYDYRDINHPELLTHITRKDFVHMKAEYDPMLEQIIVQRFDAPKNNIKQSVIHYSNGLSVTRRDKKIISGDLPSGSASVDAVELLKAIKDAKTAGAYIESSVFSLINYDCNACLIFKESTFSAPKLKENVHEKYADGSERYLTFNADQYLTFDARYNDKKLIKESVYTGTADNKVLSEKSAVLSKVYQYDDQGRKTGQSLVDIKTGEERNTTYAYTGDAIKPAQVDGPRDDINDTARFYYDDNSNLIKEVNALGHVTTYEYNASDLIIAKVDSNKRRTEYGRDSLDRIVSIVDGVGSRISLTTTITYNSNGAVSKVALPTGNVITYGYFDNGQLAWKENSSGHRAVFEQAVTHPFDHGVSHAATSIDYTDVRSLLSALTLNAGQRQDELDYLRKGLNDFTYGDTFTDPLSSTADSRKVTSGYNKARYLINPDGSQTALEYDQQGNVIGVKTPAGVDTVYRYNGFGERIEEVSTSTGRSTYEYDKSGNNIIIQRYQNGIVVHNDYDAIDRLTKRVYTKGQAEPITATYQYDSCPLGVGRICTFSSNNLDEKYRYDEAGNITKNTRLVDGIARSVIRYRYNNHNQLKRIDYPGDVTAHYTYSDIGDISSIYANINNEKVDILTSVDYDGYNRTVTHLHYGNDITTHYAYSPQGVLDAIKVGDVSNKTFSYDSEGNILRVVENGQATSTKNYEYDALNRLIYEDNSVEKITYTYDQDGNRTSRAVENSVNLNTNTVDADNTHNTNSHIDTYTYQPNSQVLTAANQNAFEYDLNGNTVRDGRHNLQYQYGENNRLIGVSQNGRSLASYLYGYNGQRIYKSSFAANDGQYSAVYQYAPNGVMLSKAVSSAEPDSTKAFTSYIWMGDLPIAQITTHEKANTTAESDVLFLHAGDLNEPRVGTNNVGEVVWRWLSDAFGVSYDNASVDLSRVDLRFPGQEFDAESGLYHNHHRQYDPSLGRYIQSDPIGLRGGVNTYAYVYQNPLMYIDPLGLNVRLENTTAVFGLHQRISVDTPEGAYGISFGGGQDGSSEASSEDPEQSKDGNGVVYKDVRDSTTEVSKTLRTTPTQDAKIAKYLKDQVGKTAPYNALVNSCRNYSQNQYRVIAEKLRNGDFGK